MDEAMKWRVIIPALTRVEEIHEIEAGTAAEARELALVADPKETIDDADFYEVQKDNVTVERIMGTPMVEQLLQWSKDLKNGDVLRLAAGLKEVAEDLVAREARMVDGLPGTEACGLFDAEVVEIIDSPRLAFAAEQDVGCKDQDGGVWVPVWFRVRRPVG